eukprot:6194705-Pleurochrysis_carterae.AAC.1
MNRIHLKGQTANTDNLLLPRSMHTSPSWGWALGHQLLLTIQNSFTPAWSSQGENTASYEGIGLRNSVNASLITKGEGKYSNICPIYAVSRVELKSIAAVRNGGHLRIVHQRGERLREDLGSVVIPRYFVNLDHPAGNVLTHLHVTAAAVLQEGLNGRRSRASSSAP